MGFDEIKAKEYLERNKSNAHLLFILDVAIADKDYNIKFLAQVDQTLKPIFDDARVLGLIGTSSANDSFVKERKQHYIINPKLQVQVLSILDQTNYLIWEEIDRLESGYRKVKVSPRYADVELASSRTTFEIEKPVAAEKKLDSKTAEIKRNFEKQKFGVIDNSSQDEVFVKFDFSETPKENGNRFDINQTLDFTKSSSKLDSLNEQDISATISKIENGTIEHDKLPTSPSHTYQDGFTKHDINNREEYFKSGNPPMFGPNLDFYKTSEEEIFSVKKILEKSATFTPEEVEEIDVNNLGKYNVRMLVEDGDEVSDEDQDELEIYSLEQINKRKTHTTAETHISTKASDDIDMFINNRNAHRVNTEPKVPKPVVPKTTPTKPKTVKTKTK